MMVMRPCAGHLHLSKDIETSRHRAASATKFRGKLYYFRDSLNINCSMLVVVIVIATVLAIVVAAVVVVIVCKLFTLPFTRDLSEHLM